MPCILFGVSVYHMNIRIINLNIQLINLQIVICPLTCLWAIFSKSKCLLPDKAWLVDAVNCDWACIIIILSDDGHFEHLYFFMVKAFTLNWVESNEFIVSACFKILRHFFASPPDFIERNQGNVHIENFDMNFRTTHLQFLFYFKT